MDAGMKDVIDVARKATEPVIITVPRGGVDEARLVALPSGVALHDVRPYLDAYRDKPERRVGTAVVTELGSFTKHVNRFKDADSVLFANDDMKLPSLTAVLDYHRAGATSDPRFGTHLTHYAFPLSEEWKFWTGIGGRALAQAEFAKVLEDRLMDIMDPSSIGEATAELLTDLGVRAAGRGKLRDLARGLDVRVDSKMSSKVNLENGETKFLFSEEHKDEEGAPLVVPSGFVIRIPVFRTGAEYQIVVRLRYRVLGGGKLAWVLDVHRPDDSFRHAFEEACGKASINTDLPVFFGSPEAPDEDD